MKLHAFVSMINFDPNLCFRIVTIPTDVRNKYWPVFFGANFEAHLQYKP